MKCQKKVELVKIKRWLSLEKLNLSIGDWLILAAPVMVFFSYHPVLSLGKGDFGTNYEFSLIQIHLMLLVLAHLPQIWHSRQSLVKNRSVLLLLVFALYNTLTLLWTPNTPRGLLTAGVIWLLFGVFLSILSNKNLPKLKAALLRIFVGGAVGICLFAIYQFIAGITDLAEATLLCAGCTADQFGFVRPNAFAIEPQFLGSLLIAPILLVTHQIIVTKNPKKLYAIAGLLSLVMFLTLSRGAIMALIFGIATLLIVHYKHAKKYTLVVFVFFLSFIGSLLAQGLATEFNPRVSDSFSQGVTKSLNQLSLGIVDLRSYSSPSQPSPEPSPGQPPKAVFDGYIERSTNERLDGSCLALNTWSSSASRILFGVGLGGTGYYFEQPISRSGLWCKMNI